MKSTRVKRSQPPQVDSDGELYSRPNALSFAWAILILLLIVEAVNEIFGVGGPTSLYYGWVHDFILGLATALILLRSIYEPRARAAWLLIGISMGMWCVGSVGWSV